MTGPPQTPPKPRVYLSLFLTRALLHTAALLHSRGSLSEAGISPTSHPGALRSDGDAEEVPPASVQPVRLKGDSGASGTGFTFYWQLEDRTPGTRFTPLISIQWILLCCAATSFLMNILQAKVFFKRLIRWWLLLDSFNHFIAWQLEYENQI